MKNPPSNPSNEIIYHVDPEDIVIGSVTRRVMREKGLCHRVTYLLVFNSAGELLVQTRTMDKDWCPGFQDFAAGGVVLAEESYELSAHRELKEELGITANLTPHFDIYFEDSVTASSSKSWGRVFSCIDDGPFNLQPEEVAAVEFIDIGTAIEIDNSLVTPDTRHVLIAYLM